MPKLVDPVQYRKELLWKAFDVLAETSYAKVTTRQLAKAMGISTGAMYHYFPSKQALFEQLVEEMGQQDIRALQAQVAGAETLSDRLVRLGQFLIDHEAYFVKQTAIWTDFCMYTDRETVSSNVVLQRVDDRYRQAIADALGIRDPQVTQFIWTLVNGVLVEHMGGHASANFAEQVHLLTQMLIAYFEKFPL